MKTVDDYIRQLSAGETALAHEKALEVFAVLNARGLVVSVPVLMIVLTGKIVAEERDLKTQLGIVKGFARAATHLLKHTREVPPPC